MKKTLLSLAIFAANFAFGQITLDNAFPESEIIDIFRSNSQIFYASTIYNSDKIHIYNSDYTLYKTVNLTLPAGYEFVSFTDEANKRHISKNIFNTDDKLEFMISYTKSGAPNTKIHIINEDGQILKIFDGLYYDYTAEIYNDPVSHSNKLKMNNSETGKFEIYSLPTTALDSKETVLRSNKLSAFPIPTTKTLNIFNPQNGSNKIEVYDASGKVVVSKSFNTNENRISVEVENLPKGNYIYKIGNLSSKFIKN